MIALALALQVAAIPLPAAQPAPATAAPVVETRADGSQRWSLIPCTTPTKPGEVVVCGQKDQDRFPGPPVGRGANRDLSGANALALQTTPCAARQGGCQVGVNVLGPPTMLVRVIQKLVNPNSDCCSGDDATNPLSLVRDVARGIKRGTAAKVDKTGRVPIPLDAPAPAGRIVLASAPAASDTPAKSPTP